VLLGQHNEISIRSASGFLRHSFIKIKATVAFPRDPIHEINAVFGGVLALKICLAVLIRRDR
jgi:hypothetical protein